MTIVGLLTVVTLLAGPMLPGKLATIAQAGVADSKVLYRRKAWEVSVFEFDDGTFACLAQVSDGGRSFAIWADTSDDASLQFYDESWTFDNTTADIIVRIDSRAKWTLNDADLNQNSVFFTLPDEDASYRFLREVMRGNTLNLYNSSGERIERYSLAGSSASIVKLTECVDLLKSADNDGNPFN
ncbi:MAG: hypothetical protein GXP03_11835 [Alphaproteobacteria bacterium]|nr:hypothetical protein [Alphaproteobacteria bacterium]